MLRRRHTTTQNGVRRAGSDQEREGARPAGAVGDDWQGTADCQRAKGRTQLVPRLNDEDRPDRSGGAHRRGDDGREVGFRGRRVRELAGRSVALGLGG